MPAHDTAFATQSPTARMGFNGELHESATAWQLLGNGYRAYNPVLMRFHSPDSLSPFNAGGLNAYTYCAGDPVNLADPTGHWVGPLALFGVSATAGVVAGLIKDEDTRLITSVISGVAGVAGIAALGAVNLQGKTLFSHARNKMSGLFHGRSPTAPKAHQPPVQEEITFMGVKTTQSEVDDLASRLPKYDPRVDNAALITSAMFADEINAGKMRLPPDAHPLLTGMLKDPMMTRPQSNPVGMGNGPTPGPASSGASLAPVLRRNRDARSASRMKRMGEQARLDF